MDIGCSYRGSDDVENIYEDIENWNIKDCGIIGMLRLEIDTVERTQKQILFKQILSPMYHKFGCSTGDYKKYTSCVLREFRGVDLFVTFNGRDFDIPIIMHNLGFVPGSSSNFSSNLSPNFSSNFISNSSNNRKNKNNRKYGNNGKNIYSRYILSRDRDLLDLCIQNSVSVKGGLEKIINRLKIGHDLRCKNCPSYSHEEMCFLDSFDEDTNRYNTNLKLVKQRNEFDVKILPLLEEKLGYLYEPRGVQDIFHKKWV